MTDPATARDRAAEMAARLDWAADNATGYAGLERVAREAADVLRALAAASAATEAHTCRPEGDPARLRTGTLWTCPVDGAQWVSVNRMIGRQMRGEWRPRPPLRSTPPPPPPPRPQTTAAPDATAIERDEAARAVVQDWSFKPLRAAVREVHENLGIALDALARAHETKDGGRDR